MSRITIAIAGLGSRGERRLVHRPWRQMPERAKVVAIADPDAAKVREVARQFEIPAERCFDSAEALLAELRLADAWCSAPRTGSMCPRPFPPSARAMTFSWKSPSPQTWPSAKRFWR